VHPPGPLTRNPACVRDYITSPGEEGSIPKILRKTLRIVAAVAAAGFALIAYVYLTLPDVRPLATTNPTTTAFMELRAREAAREGKSARRLHTWVPYRRISQNLKRAVLVAEDDAFFEHEGVDLEQLRKSIELDIKQGRAVRGGSTVTQQLAKNLYLSPTRDPLRKLRELIIARRLETALPKARIFELYLNLIEWGDEVWGAEAAARTYFHTSAASLSRDQAALLAGAIVNPRVLDPARPPARLLRRQRIILARMPGVVPPAPPPITSASPETEEPDVDVDVDVDHDSVGQPVNEPEPVPELPPSSDGAESGSVQSQPTQTQP
jgi:monofunctional glycosyltransferase